MNHIQQTKLHLALVPAMLLALFIGFADQANAGWDYGNGRHGSYVLTTNTTIEQLYQTVRLTNDPAQYNPADSNAIPNFQNLIITNSATLTANPWNGTAGGQIALKVQAMLFIAGNASISASGIGFRGGIVDGQQGESYSGGGGISGNSNNGGGGGNLQGSQRMGNNVVHGYTGGAGGGYATSGGSTTVYGVTAIGGNIYGSETLTNVFLGSGGGAGVTAYGNTPNASAGGAGGGSIAINCGTLHVDGTINANGGNGNTVFDPYFISHAGGGGSGGSILIRFVNATFGSNLVTAVGGSGSGVGGDGRIRLEYVKSITGFTTPLATTLIDTNSDNMTAITLQPVSQTNFWSSNVVFSVGFTALSPLTLQWYFNNAPIPNATNQTLVLTNLLLTDQGNYSVTISNAVMTVVSSNAFLTVLDGRDFDGDGIPNYWENQHGLNPNNPSDANTYPPGETLTFLQKYLYSLDSSATDSDGDGITDYNEIFVYHTNPLLADTDGDGMQDGWEIQHGLNPLVNDANDDADFDGVSNFQEYQYSLAHTNAPLDPRKLFSQPGVSDYSTFTGGQITNRFYYDRNDRLLGQESSRGFSFAYVYDGNDNLTRQAYLSRSSETNGLPALWRYLNGLTNNTSTYADSDGDGWTDYQEWKAGTNPRDAQSTPNLLGSNHGTNIAALVLPFTPSNFVVSVGNLDGLPGDEIVVSADGNPGTNTNFLLVLTQTAAGWSTQQVNVGSFGITSIAVGQPTNRPSVGIYVGLRGTNSIGRLMEFTTTGGIWQSNLIAISTNDVANVLVAHTGADVLASFSTNGVNAGLFSLSFSNGVWNPTMLSTNSGQQSLGTHGTVWSRILRDASIRLVNTNQIEMIAGDREAVKNGLLLPTNWAFNPVTGKYYFQSTNTINWFDGETFAQQYGTHLATISDSNENAWVESRFPTPNWIGLYMVNSGGSGGNIYGNWTSSGQPPNINYYTYHSYWEADPFYNFQLLPPYNYPATNGVCVGLHGNNLWNCLLPTSQFYGIADATGVQTYSNRWLLAPLSYPNRVSWKENQIAAGRTRPQDTNGTALLACFVSDADSSGTVSPSDGFVFAEYRISGDAVTLLTLTNIPIGSSVFAQSFGLAAVDFLNNGFQSAFTAEPNGEIYWWSASDASSPMKRQLFTSDYAGKSWHALTGVRMTAGGDGLAGLMVDPANQNVCKVIFWPPQSALSSPQSGVIETAPSAAVIPSANPLGSNAVVTIRLWDNEGNASTPFLQFQILGSTNWQNATLTALDGAAYNPTNRVATLPTGVNHSLAWNAKSDVGAGIVTNILLRVRAQDFSLIGDWSSPTPFQLNTTVASVSNPTNAPVNFTGITRVPGGIQFNWQGSTNALLYLQRSPALSGTNVNWVNIWTGTPPTLNFGSFTDFFGTNPMGFYRIQSVSP